MTFKMTPCDLEIWVRQRGGGERPRFRHGWGGVRQGGGATSLPSFSPDIQTLGERHHLNILKNHAMFLFKCLKIMVNFID